MRTSSPVAVEPDGSHFYTAPIHPDLGGEAGIVAIVLETAGEACPLGDLALPALPPADADEADEILELCRKRLLHDGQVQLERQFDVGRCG